MSVLAEALVALSRRERWLVGALLVVVLPLALVFLVVMPLADDRAAARDSVARAQDLLRWVEMQAARYPPPADVEAERAAQPGLAALEASLVTSDLRGQMASMADRGAGRVEIRFDDVVFVALMTWLDRIESSAGYRPASYTVEARAEVGRVSATVLLEAGR